MQLFTATQYLQMDIAAQHSCSSLSWDDRLAWFAANEHQLEQLTGSAEEPQLYIAAVQAWRDVQEGKAIGYPISLDATASGLQILSCLAGDKNAAAITNVFDTGARRDAYMVIYQRMLAAIGGQAKVTRKQAKNALMTALFGSTGVPKQVFGAGTPLLNIFYRTVNGTIPHAWALNEAFLAMWDPAVDRYGWVMPDGFTVNVKVMDHQIERVPFMNRVVEIVTKRQGPSPEGRSIAANMTHSIDGFLVREMGRMCDYDPAKIARVRDALANGTGTCVDIPKSKMLIKLRDLGIESGYMSYRILDYITPENVGLIDRQQISFMLDAMPVHPFKVLSNHDCFRVLPTYGNDLRLMYNVCLAKLAYSDMLSFLVSQLKGRRIQTKKIETDFFDDIIDANYSLS